MYIKTLSNIVLMEFNKMIHYYLHTRIVMQRLRRLIRYILACTGEWLMIDGKEKFEHETISE